ncbi:major facilitator superfamily domain-containing protein 6-A-like [Patiria miniata]|uniref:Major facilitator superfamily associated domain-containing protein n=1 Tax=Patiria miniata TaxID=46514 RepID=A0A914AIB1_PATMI|nr:major facilitator superfamily domain-containing protein 6-A-like [Patiria miniata]
MHAAMKLDMRVNRVLLPFKAVYFFFLAGMSCLIPFLPIYMHQLGLTITETGLIRSLEPAISFIASPVWGSLADKRSKHKLLLIVSLLGSSLLTFALIFVPSSDTPDAHDVSDNYTTNQELCPSWNWLLNCSEPEWAGSSLCNRSDSGNRRTDVCSEVCDTAASNRDLPMRVGSDVYLNCTLCTSSEMGTAIPPSKPNATVQSTSITWTYQPPMHSSFLRVFCLQLQENSSDLSRKVSKCPNKTSDGDSRCASFSQNSSSSFQECLPWRHCACSNLTATEPREVSPPPHASNLYIFSLVIALILSSKIFVCNVFPLLDSTLMLTLGTRPQDYGKQRLWGSVGWGAFAVISGAAIDAFSRGSPRTNYVPAFYLFIVLQAGAFVSSFFFNSPPHVPNKKILRNLCGLLLQANIVTFLLVVTVAGMSFGITGTYLFLFLEEIHSPHILMGLTLTVNCVSEVPFLFFAGRIIKRITYIGVAYLTLLCYAMRFLGYSLLGNAWLVLPFELLHGFTYGAFWAACTSFASANAPTGMTTTLQAVISAFHMGVGRGLGTALGGVVYQEWGSRTLFRVCLFTCLGTVVVYFLLRRFLVEGVEGPLAMYRKFSLIRGEPSSTDGARKDSCLSELDSDTCKAMDAQQMQLTVTTIDQSKPDSPPVTTTYHTHRPLLHKIPIPNTPDSPEDDNNANADSPSSISSMSRLLRMEERLPAAGQEVLEMRGEGRPPALGEESWPQQEFRGKGGKQTTV